MTPTEAKLQSIVAEKLQVAADQVPLDRALSEDLGLDSFDLMAVVIEIEQAFPPVSLAEESVQSLKTLRELAEFIDSRLAAVNGSPQLPD